MSCFLRPEDDWWFEVVIQMWSLLAEFFHFLWMSLLLLSPMLLLGLFLSGLFHVFISRQAVFRWLRDDSLKSVSVSAAVGVPVPLCSCSVVPVVTEMRRKGASRSSCMSFLITAPETGADSILVTNAFFGWVAAIVRPVISFITAVVAGIFCIGLIRGDNGTVKEEHDDSHDHDHDHDHGPHEHLIPSEDDCCISPSQLKIAMRYGFRALLAKIASRRITFWVKPEFYREELAAEDEPLAAPNVELPTGYNLPSFKTIVRHIFHYGFVEIADDILFSLLFGVAVGGLLYLAIPDTLMDSEYAQWASYPIMVLIGVPLYICASASTPIAAALVAKGFSPGAALIFLMTGPATNSGTIAVIMHQFGTRFASVYVTVVIVVTVIVAVIVDVLMAAAALTLPLNLAASTSPNILFLQYVSTFAFIVLVVWRFRAGALRTGWSDLTKNVRNMSEPLVRTWTRLSRGRPALGAISPKTPLGLTVLALIVAVYLANGFAVVPPGSVGYGRLFGKVYWKDLQPGLHYLAPPPFARIDKWPVREVKSMMGGEPREFVAGDLNLVSLTVNVQYRVRDPYTYHYRITDAPSLIRDAVRDHVRSFVSARPLEQLLTVHRETLERHVSALFQGRDSGQDARPSVFESVELVKASLSDIRPVAETISAFREVSSAQEEKERIIVNAQRLLVSMIPQAHGNADYEVKQAAGQAYSRVATSGAEADAIRRVAKAMQVSPDVLRNMLWREKLEIALSHNPKIIVPNKDRLAKVALWKRKSATVNRHMRPAHGENRPGDSMGHRKGTAEEKTPKESAKSMTPGEKDKRKTPAGPQDRGEKIGDKGKPEKSRKVASAQGEGNAGHQQPEKSGEKRGEAK